MLQFKLFRKKLKLLLLLSNQSLLVLNKLLHKSSNAINMTELSIQRFLK